MHKTLQKINTAWRLLKLAFGHFNIVKTALFVRRSHLTYLSLRALLDLSETIIRLERDAIQGLFIEAGSALGGSALVITASKQKERPLSMYDTFEMIPPPSHEDSPAEHQRYEAIKSGKAAGLGNKPYYGYLTNLTESITKTFIDRKLSMQDHHVRMVKGLFQDTMLVNDAVAFAHIDCDWYDSVMVCLERIVPHLTIGGIIVVDDYFDWQGCRKAVDTYFENARDQYQFEFKARLHIRRIQ